jgi:cytidine deaminase
MKKLSRESCLELVRIASDARQAAHAPYSRFHVGAALLSTDGEITVGQNIENSSFSLTICAERVAIFKAISEGKRKFRAIAIVSDASDITPPCGACRQVLMDLAGNIDVILSDRKDKMRVMKLKDLLPLAFDGGQLPT